jgi:penicillin-binding protein 2D
MLLLVAGAAVGMAAVNTWLKDLPDYTSPDAFEIAQPTKIYSADGQMLAKLYLQNREVVPMSAISTNLVNGVVAVEDERYFQHGGVDPVGIVRAVLTTARGDRQGASTITQQYIRNTVLLDERTDMTLARKVREAYLAIEVQKTLPKETILENYLNTVYFGQGAYGVEAASRTFFAKSAKDLTIAEGALIAGLVQAPRRLDPYLHPERSLARRQIVLDRLLKNRYITAEQYAIAVATPLVLKRASEPLNGIYSSPYYVAYVKKLLQQRFTQGVVFNGGLTVYTSLDTRLQKYAETAAKRFKRIKDPSVALVCIDPRTGYVKAMVGGKDYNRSKFNLATQGYRQPGSAFKTFVLATALSQGMPPDFKVDAQAPVEIPNKPRPWPVKNNEGKGSNIMMPLDMATWESVNSVYARVAYYGVGIKNVIKTAKAMGIQTHLRPLISVSLGTANCTPLEMASAYGTLAASGTRHDPIVITKVVDKKGQTLFTSKPKGVQAIKPQIAYATTKVLEGVITKGTASRADIGRPAAGKTGTSQDNRDAWFVGYTPQLVTAVWVGYQRERAIVFEGKRGFGGTLAAPLWAAFMRKALAGQPERDFPSASDPNYNPDKFDIPVSDETKAAAEKKKAAPTTGGGGSSQSGGGKSSKGKKKKGGGSGGGSGETSTTP